ncbi:hypothetical protein Mal4_21540 [Maioricimonas rarisocia]|uniref:Uncharacterized protein n=1 Tax=Maioricimonas rarisocia TaxID=2528026 RepID=A0A517Z5T7_9PLAN|nr:hypothetical protein [Maioricimonas rarisocia]QDU37837.1 hypothetical protein Mal4_21540 [Maioricimonas rarisocia]
MSFEPTDPERRFREAWDAVEIARPVHYSLFTFGESDLPYYLVEAAKEPKHPVNVAHGEVKVARPKIITPNTSQPEFRNFFEDPEMEGMVDFVLARSAAFQHLTFDNRVGSTEIVSDSIEEVVARLNQRLDAEEEDRVAILTAPHGLAGIAVLRYACERVMQSAPENIQELRERGFLP